MTIAIGVLCSDHEPAARPNRIVLMSDTMGSFGDVDSHSRLHKTFALPELDLYAVAANSIDKAGCLLMLVKTHMERTDAKRRTFAEIRNALQNACFYYRRDQFISHVFPKYRLAPDIFTPPEMPNSIEGTLQKEWEEFDIGCDVIFAAFDHLGQASMFYFCGNQPDVQELLFPGYAAIGSGAEKAMFWLSYRKQTLNMSCTLASFHAYESKVMAESSAHVNEHIDLIIARKGQHWTLSSHNPKDAPAGCPVSLVELEETRLRYGPQQVDTVRLSTAQKSTDRQ